MQPARLLSGSFSFPKNGRIAITVTNALPRRQAGSPKAARLAGAISVRVLGMALSLFLVTSYVLCVLGYVLFPGLPINHAALGILLPGFELLSWRTFFLGLAESFAFGWYIALLFGTMYNFFATRSN
jgi:2TM family of unknown function (DUF5676)